MAELSKRKKREIRLRKLLYFLSTFPLVLILAILISLVIKSLPLIKEYSILSLIGGVTWKPLKGLFGFQPFILGTIWVTLTGLVLAVPVSFFATIYISEYARSTIKGFIRPVLDILAAIPSVIYGVWGMIVIVPLVKWVVNHLSSIIRTESALKLIGENTTGFSILAGGIVLAVMITPFIIAISIEVMANIPKGLREASLSLGTTRWEMIRFVLLPKALPGLFAAIVLGASRAVGETMAVLMVVGNIAQIPKTVFDAAYPLTALIANNYGEMMSIPMYDAALMTAALILLIIILFFNIFSQIILRQFTKGNCLS